MAKRKTEFDFPVDRKCKEKGIFATAKIVDGSRAHLYINITSGYPAKTIPKEGINIVFKEDLETFALNILKSIGSKHLKKVRDC